MAPWPWAQTKAIHQAVESGNVAKLHRLLKDKSINVNAENNDGATGLHMAASLNDPAILEALLAHDKINPNAQGPGGKAPLHLGISTVRRRRTAAGLAAVRALLEHPLVDVNLADGDGQTPLHYAVDFQAEDAIRLLVRTPGLNYDAQDKRGRTALIWALNLELSDLAALLVSEHDFVREAVVADVDGNTALHKAAGYRSLDSSIMARLIKGLTSAVLDARNTSGLEGETALHIAARQDNVDVFEQLVIAGARLDVGRGSDGATAVHVAVQCGSLDVVKYVRRLALPLRKAAISATNHDGDTPLHLAAKLGHYEILDSILGSCVFKDELPIRTDPVEVIWVNQKGESAVGLAALHGHVEITMRLLLAEKMASEEPPSRHRKALLRLIPKIIDTFASAMPDGQRMTVELLKWRAAVDTLGYLESLRRPLGDSMLERFIVLEAGAGHLYAVQCLVSQGVDPNTCLEHVGTPLGVAAAHGRTDVMRFLLSLGKVDANLGIPGRDTPLMSAIRGRSAAAVSMLLSDELLQSSRVDLNEGPKYSKENKNVVSNPLLLISELGYLDMAKMLIRRHYVDRGWLDLRITRSQRDGSLSMACELGTWRVVELLLQAYSWTTSVDVLDFNARELFWHACASHSPETLALLLKSDLVKHKLVNLTKNYAWRREVLARACEHGRTENVRLLFGSDLLKDGLLQLDGRDHDGRTALAHACMQGAWEIVQLFLDYCLPPADELDSVDFATVDNKGKTIIDLAAESPSAMKTVWVLLDSRLVDRGLVDPRTVYQRMRGQIAYHSNIELDPNIELDFPDMRQLVQRLEELGCMGTDSSRSGA
jgi:ankyrin repeat protein